MLLGLLKVKENQLKMFYLFLPLAHKKMYGFIFGINIFSHFFLQNAKFADADGCDKSQLEKFKSSSTKVICHVLSDSSGKFEFPSVTPSRYIVTPYLKGHNLHFHPPSIEFNVEHNSVRLETTFEVIGFSISGRILNAENGKPIEKATVFLNKHQLAFSRDDGTFVLEKIKAGQHSVYVEAGMCAYIS